MNKTETIIFDMDGVIVDSEPLHERAFRETFDEMGYGQTHGMNFADYYGRSDRALWMDFIARHQPPQPLHELIAWKQQRLIHWLRQLKPIFPPVQTLLEKLAPRYRLALASGSPHQVIDEVLTMQDLRRFFEVVVSVQDVPRGKPAPDVFLRTLELLATAPSQCWVIEDSAAGVEAALAAGLRVIAITNTLPKEKLAHSHHVVQTYEEIENLLLPASRFENAL